MPNNPAPTAGWCAVQKAKMDVKTGVAQGLATTADDAPRKKVRRRDPPSPSPLVLDRILPDASRRIKSLEEEDWNILLMEGRGNCNSSSNCNPMVKDIRLDKRPSGVEGPPPNKVPAVAAMTPKVMNTDANPAAKTRVGMVGFLSFRSPAAVVMYDMVSGNNPQTQGDTLVNSPAPYMTGIVVREI